MSTLPPHLYAALNRGHAKEDIAVVVAALESHGISVSVQRLQLGDTTQAGFGQVREVYRTRKEEPQSHDQK